MTSSVGNINNNSSSTVTADPSAARDPLRYPTAASLVNHNGSSSVYCSLSLSPMSTSESAFSSMTPSPQSPGPFGSSTSSNNETGAVSGPQLHHPIGSSTVGTAAAASALSSTTNAVASTTTTAVAQTATDCPTTTPPSAPSHSSPGACSQCGESIVTAADACQAMGKIYHNSCFTCCCCKRTLRGKVFYKDQENIYCEEDYLYCGFQRRAEKCGSCGHIITDLILQAVNKCYHPGCFRCCVCSECLDGRPFTVDSDGRVFCVQDYHRMFAPRCSKCGLAIVPQVGSDEIIRVVAMDKDFHIDCFHCEDCGMELADEQEQRCFPLIECGGNVIHLLCRECHIKRRRGGERLITTNSALADPVEDVNSSSTTSGGRAASVMPSSTAPLSVAATTPNFARTSSATNSPRVFHHKVVTLASSGGGVEHRQSSPVLPTAEERPVPASTPSIQSTTRVRPTYTPTAQPRASN